MKEKELGRDAQATWKKRFWPAVAAVLAVGLIISVATRPGERVVEREKIVYREAWEAPGSVFAQNHYERQEGSRMANYLQLQRQVLEKGMDGLPESGSGTDEKPVDLGELLQS